MMREIREEWRENLPGSMPDWLIRHMRMRLSEGMDHLIVVYALREAGMAPRPSWKYAEAVLKRCLRENAVGVWLLEEQKRRTCSW